MECVFLILIISRAACGSGVSWGAFILIGGRVRSCGGVGCGVLAAEMGFAS